MELFKSLEFIKDDLQEALENLETYGYTYEQILKSDNNADYEAGKITPLKDFIKALPNLESDIISSLTKTHQDLREEFISYISDRHGGKDGEQILNDFMCVEDDESTAWEQGCLRGYEIAMSEISQIFSEQEKILKLIK